MVNASSGFVNGSEKLAGFLATARIANVPSVISNVFTGVAVASLLGVGGGNQAVAVFGSHVLWACLAAVCLYLAGNFLNDWHDREWDAKNRPERALPRCLYCSSTYLLIAIGFLAIAGISAWALAGRVLVLSGVIACCVLAYTWLHKRTGWGVVWVALCRALLVVLGVAAVVDPANFDGGILGVCLASLPLFCYIVGLSISARFESKGTVPKRLAIGSASLLVLPLMIAGIYGIRYGASGIELILGALPYVTWVFACYRIRKNVGRYVSGLLAGIPLVDGMILLPLVLSSLGAGFVVEPVWYLVFPAAFLAGLLLQKIAPAS